MEEQPEIKSVMVLLFQKTFCSSSSLGASGAGSAGASAILTPETVPIDLSSEWLENHRTSNQFLISAGI